MTYKIEIKDGHHIVDMAPEDGPDILLEILKCMTGYKAVETFAEALADYRRKYK